jgi:hypothetical protein
VPRLHRDASRFESLSDEQSGASVGVLVVAEARVLPVLVPSIARVRDFVTGAAKLFTGDFDSDRKLLVETISGVLVYPSGSLVVQFQEASLFEPMRFAQLPNVPKGQDRDLAKARAAARREVQEQRAEIERAAGEKALENLEMDVETDADGNPAFIIMTAGVVKRTFGGAQASARRSDEVAYVSPAGVESEAAVLSTRTHVDSRASDLPRVDVSAREPVSFGPSESSLSGSVEDALALALTRASEAERWDVVSQLARELEARRLAGAGVVSLEHRRSRR